MKNELASGIGAALILIGGAQAIGLTFWLVGSAINTAIAHTEAGRKFSACVHEHMPEILNASTTWGYQEALKNCPPNPYL